MVATRSLQLTVKKTTRQQKTLEGQLLMVKDGERTAISSRVAELDQIMPQYLGVSKAILDSVIFCHQDESLWPLSEPSVLKKKFDEIFEAMKYTKAIENIKALRKKQNEELAKYKIMEQHAKEDKEKADRAEKRSLKLQEEIEALREETQRLSQEMRRAAENADRAWKQSESYAQILGALEGKRIEAASIQSNIENIKRHLVEVDESDEWLQNTLEQFESRQAEYREQEAKQKERYKEIREQIENARHQLGLKQAEYGRYENDKAQYERQVERRANVIKDIARRNNIRGYDGTLDESEMDDFMLRLRKLVKDQNHALDRARKEGQAQLREAQNTLNEIAQRRSALQESKAAARRQISENDQEAASYQRRLDQIDVDEGTIAILESKVETVESRLKVLKETAASVSWDREIQEVNNEIKSLEDESARLNAELIAGTKRAGELARLDHLKKDLKDKSRQLETLSAAHGERLSELVNSEWKPESLEQDFQRVLEEATKAVTAAERDRDGLARDVEHAEYRFKNARKDIKQRLQEKDECAKKIREAIEDEPDQFPEVLKWRQGQLDIARKDADQFAGMGEYLNKCLEAANQRKVCRTCARPFKTENEFQVFKNRLEALVKKATQDAEDSEIKQLEADLEAARAVNSEYDEWVRLGTKVIPDLEKEQAEADEQRQELIAKLERLDKVVDERTDKKREIESLSKTVVSIVRCDAEIKSLRSQIAEIAAQQQVSESSRTLEDIQDEIAGVGEKTRAARRTLSKLTNERDQSRAEINKLELEVRDMQTNLSNARHELDRKADLAARIEEYRKMNNKQREIIEKADQDIEQLAPEMAKAQARHDELSQRSEARERELQEAASQLSDSLHQLELANEEIRSYIDRGGPDLLQQSKNDVAAIQQEIESLEAALAEITREINRISSQLADSDNTKRQYADNLSYRQACRQLEQVEQEIAELEAQNAEIDRSRFKEESERWTREHNALAAKQASKMGEMKSKDDQLMQLLADWNTDYKDAAAKYKEAHIKVETTKAAIEDLGRYGGALDKAIMKYHSLKMEEINRIIEELWQRTYRGTDVDTILIRSDSETARGNRSYNYRVCMVKQGAEMDMRGRCSAGQKVLASIIIRLALAECFGVNCGLIALDEPTTNLDRDNIRSLAESLHEIIRARQQQSNFQLIVITHDEEFLRHMQCGDFADYYYRVSRNERQKSIIERQSIAEVCPGLSLSSRCLQC